MNVTTVLTLALLTLASLMILGGALIAAHQVSAQDAILSPLEMFFTDSSAACLGQPAGFVCNGGLPLTAEPDGPVSHSLAAMGALVDMGVIDALATSHFAADCTTGGVAWFRVAETQSSGLLLGQTAMRDASAEGFPAWQSMIITTAAETSPCAEAPVSAVALQTTARGIPTLLVVNGASLDLNGTVLIQTQDTPGANSETVFITLEGQARVIALGHTEGMVAGQQVRVPYIPGDFSRPVDFPAAPTPYDAARVQRFPVPLLDRPLLLPQPGYVTNEGMVNLRSAPNTGAGLIMEVPPGQIMTILGVNPAADWVHVRLATGETGWMFRELLTGDIGALVAQYEATPQPPQRYGFVGSRGTITSSTGAAVYADPDPTFAVIGSFGSGQEVTLLARSPYSLWVKVNGGGLIGWVPLLVLETQVILESLPIDYEVSPLPLPTLVPGSWGNAFPDPDCYPDC
jgi:hypothetical protein